MSQGQFNEMSSRMRTMAHDWSVGSGCGKGKGKGKQLEDIASKGKGKDTNTEPVALANTAHCPATALQTWAVHVWRLFVICTDHVLLHVSPHAYL